MIATVFGLGKFPIASGTVASGATIVLVVFLGLFHPLIYVCLFMVIFPIGWYCAGQVEKAIGEKDSSIIVIDEVAGMLIACFLIPSGWVSIAAGFFLFRLFDIWKPFPARWFEERFSGGAGVMLDDVIAGLYANLVIQGVWRFWA